MLVSSSKAEVLRNVTFDKIVPTAADKEAAPEADKITTKVSKNISHNVPLSAQTTRDSDAISLDIDLGPTYSTDMEALHEATEELESAVEDTSATSVMGSSSAPQPEQSRYPQETGNKHKSTELSQQHSVCVHASATW